MTRYRTFRVRKHQGFKPNPLVKILRLVSGLILGVLRIHGRSRWSNEFVQAIDASMRVPFPGFGPQNDTLWFRTGHGRLFWRVRETPHEEPETNHWIASFSEKDVFMDVGANIGIFSIAAAKFRRCTVYAIEPDLMNARMLYENVIRNGVGDRVIVLPVALDSKSRIVDFYLKSLSYGDALHNIRMPSDYVHKPSGFVAKIAALTAKDLLTNLNLPLPTRVKIDVDGLEGDVISGFQEELAGVSEIMVEVDLSRASSHRIELQLRELGFEKILQGRPTVQWSSTVNSLYRKKRH